MKKIALAYSGGLDTTVIIPWLNETGGRPGTGIIDADENRVVGMKSHGLYETPAGSIIMEADKAFVDSAQSTVTGTPFAATETAKTANAKEPTYAHGSGGSCLSSSKTSAVH